MPEPSQSGSAPSVPWSIHGRFVIDAATEEEADRALRAIERAAKRAGADVTMHVHASEARDAS